MSDYFNEGFTVFYRKITKWEWYKKENMLHVFFHLIVSANHKDARWEGRVIKRGQLITGRKALSKATGISQQKIRTILDRLEATGEITRKSTNKNSLITIVNYDEYQTQKKPINQQSTSNQPAINQQSTTNNNVNNVNNSISKGENSPEPPPFKKVIFNPQKIRPDWIPEKDWTDIITHRKKHPKKPVQTERAYKGIIDQLQQAIDAGYSLNECLDKWLNNSSWMTFKLEYIQNSFCPIRNNGQQKRSQNQQYAIELLKEM